MLPPSLTFSTIQARVRRNRRHMAVLLPILMLTLLLPARGQADSPPPPDITLLAPPRVSTGSDQAMARVDPQVLREAKQAPDGGTVGIIIVTQGPLHDVGGLQSVVRQRPDANGLTFTSARVSPSALAK